MSHDTTLNLLIIEDSINDVEHIASLLRNAGMAAHAGYAEDEEALMDLLDRGAIDGILVNVDLPDIDAARIARRLAQHDTPHFLILLSDKPEPEKRNALMATGACDMVQREDEDHLRLVIQREFTAQRLRLEASELREHYAESEKRCKLLMESSRDAIAYLHEGIHVYANQPYLEMQGFGSFDDLEGLSILDFALDSQKEGLKRFMKDYSHGRSEEASYEVVLVRPDGSESQVEMELSPATLEGETVTQLIIRSQNDTKQLEDQITYLSQRDLLTGLFNRQYLFKELEQHLQTADSISGVEALLHIQLDNTEELRNKIGLAGIDMLVSDIGQLITHLIDDEDILARYSSDSFALMTSRQNVDALESLADEILNKVASHISEIRDASVTTTCSIGISLIDPAVPDPNEVVNRAERASREVEARGGNSKLRYQPKAGEMSQAENDEEWVRRIRDALRDNRFKLVYQPILSLRGEECENYEVFIRMLNPDGSIIPPADFMPSAERTDIARGIDRWVLLNTLKQVTHLSKKGHDACFHIHLSPNSVADEELVSWISDRFNALRILPQALSFQLREADVAGQMLNAKRVAKGLRDMGCKVVLDEFGTGSNPFQLLDHLEVNKIKLNRAYMKDITTNSKNLEAVQSLIQESHTRGLAVTVPNVEDAMTLSTLWSSGSDFVQGNFIQPTMDEPNFDFSSALG